MVADCVDRQEKLEELAPTVRRIAHDFGNVLTGILGFTELAMSQLAANGPARRYLEEAYRAAQQGVQLIDQLRLFSRRNASTRSVGSVASVAVQEQVRLQESVQDQAPLELTIATDLPYVALDEMLLRQLLGPLLDNAYEALGENGRVFLRAALVNLTREECGQLLGQPDPGPYIVVTVQDDGCGIAPETQARIFTELFCTTKPRHRGLGLLVAYGVLHACGGGLRWQSEAGKGSTFEAYLPLAEFQSPSGLTPETKADTTAGQRVLVVDDDPNVLRFVRSTLEQAGYRVESTESSVQALATYASAAEPFGLVVSDVLMPNLTGVDLARRLRGQDAGVNMVFMSGHVPHGEMKQYFADNQFELLEKPFRPERLLGAVRAALARGVLGGPSRNSRPGLEKPVAVRTTC